MTNLAPVFPRVKSPVNPWLDRQLIAYAAAAAAAGVGAMAASPVAEAKVIYTPTNVSIGGRATVPIDVNNDGTADFDLVTRECGSHSTCLVVNALAAGNGIRGTGSNVAAGFFGVPAGPGEKFLTGSGTGVYGNALANAGGYGGYSFSGGNWAHTTNRYMGLKFSINGQTHYGWARLNVDLLINGKTVLTGYAYETTPNQKILEGHTQGTSAAIRPAAEVLTPRSPASLAILARGSEGFDIWRRDDKESLSD